MGKIAALRLWIIGGLLVAAMTACAGSSQYMQRVEAPQPIGTFADKATVVFVRPSGLGFAVNIAILDQQGHWVGDAVAESHFAVALPPGQYMFLGWAENTAAMSANLATGRIYYVEVSISMGALSPHVSLEALTARHHDWQSVSLWLRDTKRLEPLPTGVAYIEGRRDDSMKRVASAQENWQGYSNEDKELRTLRLEDGTAAASATPAVTATAAIPSPAVAAPAAAPSCPPGAVCPAAPASTAPPSPQPPPSPTLAALPVPSPQGTCFPPCRAEFMCSSQGQCISLCNPVCGAGERCTATGACEPEPPAKKPVASANRCQPNCKRGFLCTPQRRCVSACNPPCAAGERCTDTGTCESK